MIQTLSMSEMEGVLQSHTIGTFACTDGKKPYIFPMAYAYASGVLYGQTTEGLKTAILRKNPEMCFSVVENHEGGWRSVLCWGKFEELDFEKISSPEIAKAVEYLSKKLKTVQDVVGVDVPIRSGSGAIRPLTINGKKATLFRMRVTEMTGKGK